MRSLLWRFAWLWPYPCHARPDGKPRVLVEEWQAAYDSAKALAVGAANACGREDLARSLADQHEFLEGIVSLCHAAEMRQVGEVLARRGSCWRLLGALSVSVPAA